MQPEPLAFKKNYMRRALEYSSYFIGCMLAARAILYYILSLSYQPLNILVRSIGCDVMVSLMLGFIIARLPFVCLRMALALCITYLAASNIEYVFSNGSNINFLDAAELLETQFLFGSAISWPLAYKFIGITACGIVAFCCVRRVSTRLLAALYVFCATFVLLPAEETVAEWLSTNFIENNVMMLVSEYSDEYVPTAETELLEKTIYNVDLNGTPYVQAQHKQPNILLIAIEGLSHQHMLKGWTPHLKKRTANGVYFSNFIAPNRVTVNGHYALLCGDYPALGRRYYNSDDKLGKIVSQRDGDQRRKTPLACLPHLLKGIGYETKYIQATSTTYRREKRFMLRAGFNQIVDDDNFSIQGEKNSSWGPVDSIIFENAKLELKKLNHSGQPWFSMIMTEGTHDPFTVPTDCKAKKSRVSNQQNTFRCMDEALDNFLNWLYEQKITNNTLVMVTSDEATVNGYSRNSGSVITGLLSDNHSLLLVLNPEKTTGINDNYFMQSDMLVSVMDYLQRPDLLEKHGFGRSIFRKYNEFRPICMGMAYRDLMHAMPNERSIITCFQRKGKCVKHYLLSGQLFDGNYINVPLSKEERIYNYSAASVINNHLVRHADGVMVAP